MHGSAGLSDRQVPAECRIAHSSVKRWALYMTTLHRNEHYGSKEALECECVMLVRMAPQHFSFVVNRKIIIGGIHCCETAVPFQM